MRLHQQCLSHSACEDDSKTYHQGSIKQIAQTPQGGLLGRTALLYELHAGLSFSRPEPSPAKRPMRSSIPGHVTSHNCSGTSSSCLATRHSRVGFLHHRIMPDTTVGTCTISPRSIVSPTRADNDGFHSRCSPPMAPAEHQNHLLELRHRRFCSHGMDPSTISIPLFYGPLGSASGRASPAR